VVNKQVEECLIFSEAFDDFRIDRLHLAGSLEHMMSETSSLQKVQDMGQFQLFDMFSTKKKGPLLSNSIYQSEPF
jgi:DNA polymerase III alpha subunit